MTEEDEIRNKINHNMTRGIQIAKKSSENPPEQFESKLLGTPRSPPPSNTGVDPAHVECGPVPTVVARNVRRAQCAQRAEGRGLAAVKQQMNNSSGGHLIGRGGAARCARRTRPRQARVAPRARRAAQASSTPRRTRPPCPRARARAVRCARLRAWRGA
ncbi:hypothetical protein T492DRAFT_8821 [Pavlovales sp. CCMP2436]|nr:hypothetical protein T492DRAFT_8821 [Pavlovales sp. CCMP2436]